MLPFVPWPSIEGLPHLLKKVPFTGPGEVTFRCKPKMHGTYAGIHIFNGEFQAQSRTKNISIGDDNFGFAAWVAENINPDELKLYGLGHCIIHGEWAGPGIIAGTSLTKLKEKHFFPFCFEFISAELKEDGTPRYHEYFLEVDDIVRNLPEKMQPEVNSRVRVLPFYPLEVTMDFDKMTGITEAAELIAAELVKFDVNDPYVSQEFGVEGNGEGLVFYPIVNGNLAHSNKNIPVADNENTPISMQLMFKCKTEKHKVAGTKELVPTSIQNVASAKAFAVMFVTQARIDQALTANGITVMEKPKIGPVMGWLVKDIQKESVAELEASELLWTDVSSAVAEEARKQLMALCPS